MVARESRRPQARAKTTKDIQTKAKRVMREVNSSEP